MDRRGTALMQVKGLNAATPATRRENWMRTCRTSAVGGLKLPFLPIWMVIGAILFGIGLGLVGLA
jgi:hypothetical protein